MKVKFFVKLDYDEAQNFRQRNEDYQFLLDLLLSKVTWSKKYYKHLDQLVKLNDRHIEEGSIYMKLCKIFGTFFLRVKLTKSDTSMIDKNKTNSKLKFYNSNRDIFLRYFDSIQQYQALIDAGNWKKIEQIISENSDFDFDKWTKNSLIN